MYWKVGIVQMLRSITQAQNCIPACVSTKKGFVNVKLIYIL